MNTITLEGKVRQGLGTKATKDLKAEGMIPCNLYGKSGNVNFYAPMPLFKKLVFTQEFNKVIIKTDDGRSFEAIAKEYQFDPMTDNLIHVDFLELVPGKMVNVNVPIQFTGNAIGVKDGGKLVIKTRRVKYKALSENLVDHIKLDISDLGLGKTIKIKDLTTVEGIQITMDGGIPVASIEIPRAMRNAAAAEAKADKKKK